VENEPHLIYIIPIDVMRINKLKNLSRPKIMAVRAMMMTMMMMIITYNEEYIS
jgi:hypothetical protein